MNSLTELNNFSATSTSFTDYRAENVIFLSPTAVTQYVTAYQGQDFSLPHGIQVQQINSQSISPNIAVNFQSLFLGNLGVDTPQGSTNPLYPNERHNVMIEWPDKKPASNVSLSGNTSTLTGIGSAITFNTNCVPKVRPPSGQPTGTSSTQGPNWGNLAYGAPGTYTISSTFRYMAENVPMTKTWDTIVTLKSLFQATTPSPAFSYDDSATLVQTTSTVTGQSLISNLGDATLDDDQYKYTVSAYTGNLYVGVWSTTGSLGGTSTWVSNGSAYYLDVRGNLAQVNSHISSLKYTPPTNFTSTFDTHYNVTNLSKKNYYGGSQKTFYQGVGSTLLNNTTPYTYQKNISEILVGTATVNNVSGNVLGNHIVTIYPTVTSKITSISSTGTGGFIAMNPTTKVYTIYGTKADVNSRLANVTIQPGLDVSDNIIMSYSLTTPEGATATKNQSLTCNNTTVVSYGLVPRSFVSNTAAQTVYGVGSIPQILETVPAAGYKLVVAVTGGAGRVGFNETDLSTSWSYGNGTTTNRATVNSIFNLIKFWPSRNFTGTANITMTLYRNGVAAGNIIDTQSATLTVTQRVTPLANVSVTLTTSQTYTPTFEVANYMLADFVLVGGGGGGGGYAAGATSYGGGGGGGGNVSVYNNQTPVSSYVAVIGAGGAIATNGINQSGNGGNTSITSIALPAVGGKFGTRGVSGLCGSGGANGDGRAGTAGVPSLPGNGAGIGATGMLGITINGNTYSQGGTGASTGGPTPGYGNGGNGGLTPNGQVGTAGVITIKFHP